MKSLILCGLISLLFVFVDRIPGQIKSSENGGGKLFYGKMRPELQSDLVHVYQRVFRGVSQTTLRFTPPLAKGTIVSSGIVSDLRSATGETQMLLVEPPSGEPFVAVDSNLNGVFETIEGFALEKSEHGFASIIKLPFAHRFFKTYPMLVHYVVGFKHPDLKPTDRLLFQSVGALAYADVDIGARKVLFQYPFDAQDPDISTTDGLFGVDVDGNGRIRDEQFSPESSYATKNAAIFKLGDLFVSTENVDLAQNQVTVRTRRGQEYLRHDVEIGKQLPDFSFVDFDGRKRSLYEFKGKYVLLDFWGAWCIDCHAETQFHKEAYKLFRARGLEILSLNTDEKIETGKSYVLENGITWTQATNDSIRDVVEVTFQIQEYPSTILIGPDAKVIVFDQKQLRSNELLRTLDRILPRNVNTEPQRP